MSPWKPKFWQGDDFSKQKQPPPEHGIKAGKLGESWWAKHWIAALEQVLGADSGRLARGRAYARSGRTHDLRVESGKVCAKVTGSRPKPYDVTLKLSPLSDDTWQRVLAEMASKAQFAAQLLTGQMPQALNEVFVACGTSLFPKDRKDLVTSCSCPDDGDPCKHVAATHYVLGEALDRDPFLLLELRGRTREQVLEALRASRGATPTTEPRAKKTEKKAREPALPSSVDYDAPRAALPTLDFSFEAPRESGAMLRQLGAPDHWQKKAAPAEALSPLIRAAAERARRLALSDTERESSPEDDEPPPAMPAKRPSKKRGQTR